MKLIGRPISLISNHFKSHKIKFIGNIKYLMYNRKRNTLTYKLTLEIYDTQNTHHKSYT